MRHGMYAYMSSLIAAADTIPTNKHSVVIIGVDCVPFFNSTARTIDHHAAKPEPSTHTFTAKSTKTSKYLPPHSAANEDAYINASRRLTCATGILGIKPRKAVLSVHG
eukprot:scaffold72068_cov18-Prasinocladus_malaysianus.AAC.1